MIDLRTHLASLVAVFLALGIGILIGVDMIGGKALIAQEKATARSLEVDLTNLHHQNVQLGTSLKAQNATIASLNQFGQETVPVLVAGRLAGVRVAIVTTPGADAAGLAEVVREAGGAVGPIVALSPLTASRTNLAASYLGVNGTVSGVDQALAQILSQALASGKSGQLPGLRSLGLFRSQGGFGQTMNAVLLICGRVDGKDAVASTFGVDFVQDLKNAGVTVVEGESLEVPTAVSTVPLFKGLGIATVDDVDTPPGQVAVVWGLGGDVGNWGQKVTAQSLMPAIGAGH